MSCALRANWSSANFPDRIPEREASVVHHNRALVLMEIGDVLNFGRLHWNVADLARLAGTVSGDEPHW